MFMSIVHVCPCVCACMHACVCMSFQGTAALAQALSPAHCLDTGLHFESLIYKLALLLHSPFEEAASSGCLSPPGDGRTWGAEGPTHKSF